MQQYIVQPHDRFYRIAHGFGVAHIQLLSVNPQFRVPFILLIPSNPQILHHNYITVGQLMSIPSIPITIIAPTQLKAIESNAEDVIDAINVQDWNKVNSKLSIIKSDFNELEPILQSNSISPSLIYRINNAIINLDEEIASRREYESKVQANLITLYVSYILDYYKAETPTNIDKLDFLGRELILNAEKSDWDSANNNLDFVNVIWKDLEPKLPSKNLQDAIEFSQIIDSLGESIKNKDSAQTIINSNDMLDKVSEMEGYFQKQNDGTASLY